MAGWLVTFAGCLGLWLTAFFIAVLEPGANGSSILWLAILAPVSLAPLYIFRPRIGDCASG